VHCRLLLLSNFFFVICFEGPQSGPWSAGGAVISGAETWCKVLSICCSWILSSFSFLHFWFLSSIFFPWPFVVLCSELVCPQMCYGIVLSWQYSETVLVVSLAWWGAVWCLHLCLLCCCVVPVWLLDVSCSVVRNVVWFLCFVGKLGRLVSHFSLCSVSA